MGFLLPFIMVLFVLLIEMFSLLCFCLGRHPLPHSSARAGRAAIGAPGLLHDYTNCVRRGALEPVPAEVSPGTCVRDDWPSASARGAAEGQHAPVSAPASC